jgi:hypothetical protein
VTVLRVSFFTCRSKKFESAAKSRLHPARAPVIARAVAVVRSRSTSPTGSARQVTFPSTGPFHGCDATSIRCRMSRVALAPPAPPKVASLPQIPIAVRLLHLGTVAVFLLWLAGACWALAYLVSH